MVRVSVMQNEMCMANWPDPQFWNVAGHETMGVRWALYAQLVYHWLKPSSADSACLGTICHHSLHCVIGAVNLAIEVSHRLCPAYIPYAGSAHS